MKATPCPTCGHVPTAKRAQPIWTIAAGSDVDVDSLSDAELRAYRHKTAPYADLQFMLSNGEMSDALRTDALELSTHVDAAGKLQGYSRADFYRQYFRLSDRKRVEWNRTDWPRRQAAILRARQASEWADARAHDAYIVAMWPDAQAA